MDRIALNSDDNLRQKIMGINANYRGGTAQYTKMTLSVLNELIDNNFVNLDEKQNNAPTVGEFRDFLLKHKDKEIYLHGYMVSPNREDYRISVEGLEAPLSRTGDDMDFTDEIYQAFCNADVIDFRGCKFFCWYD